MNRTLPHWFALLTVLLTGCVPVARGPGATAIPAAPGNRPTTAVPSLSSLGPQTSPGCYYVWATRELPELTEAIQAEFGRLDANIRASAYGFGEECRGEDGTVTFLPMETDFRVRIPVTSLADDASLGEWIARAMSVVEALPASEVPGTRPGRVEFEFYVDESAGLRLIVEISRYRNEAGGLDSASIFRLFRQGP